MAHSAEAGVEALLEASYEWDVFALPDSGELRTRLLDLYRARRAQTMRPHTGDHEIGTVLAINNVVESWFLSLREHGREGDLAELTPVRRLFYENVEDDWDFLRWLGGASPSSSILLIARDELSRQLRGKVSADGVAPSASDHVRGIVELVHREQRMLVERIVATEVQGDPQMVYRQLLATMDSRTTRRKLVHAWDRIAVRHLGLLSDAFWEDTASPSRRIGSVPGPVTAPEMIVRFLRAAQQDAAELCSSLDSEADVHVDLPFLLRKHLPKPAGTPILTVEEGMRIAEFTLANLAGVSMSVVTSDESRWVLRLSSGATELTQVSVRIAGIRRFRNNYTQPLRNHVRLRSGQATARSVVSCELSRDSRSRPGMTFQNVVSLLHELGHAVQHGWDKKAPVNLAGLESVPSELSESTSLFLEKGAFSRKLSDVLARPDLDALLAESRAVNAMTQRVTARERGLSASLAVALHHRDRDAFDVQQREVSLDVPGTAGEFVRSLVEVATDDSLASPWRYVVGGVESAQAIRAGMCATDLLRDHRPLLDQVGDYFAFYRAQSLLLDEQVPAADPRLGMRPHRLD